MPVNRPRLVLSLLILLSLALAPLSAGCGGCRRGTPALGTGRAVVTLFNTFDLAEVDLATGKFSLTSTDPLLFPYALVASPSGKEAYLMGDGGNWGMEGLLHQLDLSSPPRLGPLVRDMMEDDYDGYAHAGALGGGRLGIVNDANDFYLWDAAAGQWRFNYLVPGGRGFWDVAANPEGTLFYVADYFAGPELDGGVFVFDRATALVQTLLYADLRAAIPATTNSPSAIGVSPDGDLLALANYDSDWGSPGDADDLLFLKLDRDGRVLADGVRRVALADADDPSRVACLYDSQGLEFSADGKRVFVAGDENGTVAAIEVGSGRVDVLQLDPGADPAPHPAFLVRAGGKLYLPGYDGWGDRGNDILYVVDEATLTVTGKVALPEGSCPTSVAVVH